MASAGSWKGRRVLVTGAGGFIGSHVVEALVARGAVVRAFVHYNSRHDVGLLRWVPADVVGAIEIVAGDLRDPTAVDTSVETVEVIVHLGALIGIPYSYRHPRDVIDTNVMGTVNVLTAARRHGTPRIVHASTSEVYGSALSVPITEQHPLQAQSPYAASKIAADKIVESFHCSYGLPVCTIRPFNTYGPRQSDRAVIPTIVSQALRGRELRLGALWPRRDFTFVRDTAEAFVAAGACGDVTGVAINLGSNVDSTIGDVARMVLRLIGRDLPIREESERVRPEASEVRQLRADNARARALLGWTPTVPLEQGLKETIEWIQAHADLYDTAVYRI
jgi:NAD dependent epimerase/dehydratase